MSQTSENESEILLGNKQLLGVFAVVALLLAIAFTGGYMLGKTSIEKRSATAVADAGVDTGVDTTANPLTKTVVPEDATPAKTEAPPQEALPSEPAVVSPPMAKNKTSENVLGAPKVALPVEAAPAQGQTFLQVSALTHIQAAAMADVLRNKKYHARIAPKPGSTAIYRVLVGPLKDAGDLSSTRDSLRKIGFRDVIVQRY